VHEESTKRHDAAADMAEALRRADVAIEGDKLPVEEATDNRR
jgi:hypothetical protein